MDHQREFVEQIGLQQEVDQRRATGDANVLARLLLQPGDFLREICCDQGRVLPLDLVQRRRDDDLGCVVDMACISADRLMSANRAPTPDKSLAQEDRVLRGKVCLHRRHHVVVEIIELPLVGRLYDAVE